VNVSRRKHATYKTSAGIAKATQDVDAKMDRQFAMSERFIGEWAANQKKSLELQEKQAQTNEKQAQTREKEAAMKEKESAVRNMQVLLSTGELSPTSKQKLVKSIANLLIPAVL
jgi:malic enzyme